MDRVPTGMQPPATPPGTDPLGSPGLNKSPSPPRYPGAALGYHCQQHPLGFLLFSQAEAISEDISGPEQ